MKYIVILSIFLNLNITSTELILSKEQLKDSGYKKVKHSSTNKETINKAITKLSWPFEAPYKNGFIGNNYVQFQPYSPTAGYHSGVDMILEKNSWVQAPVSGRLEAGHYGYENNTNGTATKWWKPWPQSGESAYFEVAVIGDDGLRYELHHVDRTALTKEVIKQLNSENPYIKAGQRISRVYNWRTFFHYHHVHLNVVDQKGLHLNPELFFKDIQDSIPPQVRVLAIFKSKSIWINDGDILEESPLSIVFIGHDKKDNNKFNQVPTRFSLHTNGKEISGYNFNKSYLDKKNKVHELSKVFPKNIILPSGRVMKRNTGYYPNGLDFAVELNNPQLSKKKSYTASAYDSSNNETSIRFSL